MKFGYTIFYVKDVEATLGFYEKAFGFKKRFMAEGGDYGELETGATVLSFASHGMAKKNGLQIQTETKAGHFPMEIAFTTDMVDSVMKKAVSAGAKELKKPEKKPWGQTVGYVEDINGFVIEICTPIQA